MKRKRMVTRVAAVMLTASMVASATPFSSVTALAGNGSNVGWTVNVGGSSGVLSSEIQGLFDEAVSKYTGETLVPLVCYGVQVVAGYNYYMICRQGGELKNVVLYQDPQDQASIASVEDFDINQYAQNHTYDIPEEPCAGGTEVYRNMERCELPSDAREVFESAFYNLNGVSRVPVAYLGNRSGEGIDYAYLCQRNAVVVNPDIYLDLIIINKGTDGTICLKSTYTMMASKGSYIETNGLLNYSFSGNHSNKAGYAQGKITLSANEAGTYKIYWADNYKALEGYYPIGSLKLGKNESGEINLGYHTVIPAGATKIIATTDSLYTSEAYSVFNIPRAKQLNSDSGKKLYSFSAFSDIHIDKGSQYYVNAEANWKQALKYSAEKNSDYVIVSGDCVTNDSGPDKEWDAYAKVLSKSDFVGPVWESDGNHDMRQGVSSGLKSFIKGSGTDGSGSSKAYFSMTEPTTGDIFIFMALELNKSPHHNEEFSDEQLAWVKDLIEKNYQNHNIFLIQHSPIQGFGAGDRMEKPYYSGLLTTDNASTKAFKKFLTDYPNITFLSGHTHEDFVMDYNYSDENGTAANMIHIPSLAGSTMPDSKDSGLERNNGKGFHSQAYYVEVYENEIVFSGFNVKDEMIYPAYSYIMEGSRTENSPLLNANPEKEYTGDPVDASAELSRVSSILSSNYSYASYDSYQSLKKLYYEYRSYATVPQGVIDEFERRIQALGVFVGEIAVYPVQKTYYMANSKNWSSVYAYAWNDSNDKNAQWPGVKLSKVGTNSDGKDIYSIDFAKAGEYTNLIFNDGSNTNQTVDIPLVKYAGNAFSISSLSSGKYTVKNFSYQSEDSPQDPENPVVTGDDIKLLYYIADEHGWSDQGIKFTKYSDGKYRLSYNATGEKNFSFSLYNKTKGKYYCVPESQKPTFAEGQQFSYGLDEMSSRGKSITIYGMTAEDSLEIEYDQETNKIVVYCSGETEVLKTGWQKIDGQWSYFNEAGIMQTDWQFIGSEWYYFDDDGIMQSGWQEISRIWYYFDGGAMVTGWKQMGGNWYYFGRDGAMTTGWKFMSSKWYYFNTNGSMTSGWKKIGEKWYYFNADGSMVTGWKQIGSKWYFFKNAGAMAANEWCGGYWLNGDGTWTYKYKASWKQNSRGWWYGDTSGWYAKNTTVTIDGKKYVFDASGYLK